jgi:hypothetical protein
MTEPHVISGLQRKRSEIAGQIVELRRQLDRLQADLFHIDAVLKIYGLMPEDLPMKGRAPVRSAYFSRNEITRRCLEAMRDRGIVSAHDIAAQAMLDKGLDPESDKKQCADFTRRILVGLHDLWKAGHVEKIGQKNTCGGSWLQS